MWQAVKTALGAVLLAGFLWTGAVQAQDVLSPNKGIEGTITNQIDAFLVDDFDRAFTFASPNIQGLFGTPENFGAMVRKGYPMVWRPEDVQFGDLREIAGGLWQMVFVRDGNGKIHVLDYQMVRVDGVWKISGVQLLPEPDLSV